MRSGARAEGKTRPWSGAGRKGQAGPGGLRPRVAASGPALSPEAARPGRGSPPAPRRTRGCRVLAGAGERGVLGAVSRGWSVRMRVALKPTCAGGSAGDGAVR